MQIAIKGEIGEMNFSVEKLIGSGTFGEVKLAKNEDNEEVAIKFFKNPGFSGVSEEELKKRFSREVRYQSQISHPNVVKILAQNLEDDKPWFAMELAECSMKELSQDGDLDDDRLRAALFDILSGLEAIHSAGFKHRDLKPANVLFFSGPDGGRFAISDMGLSAAVDGDTSTLTASGATGGTENYAAPEMAVSLRRSTVAADIYSFGAILHDFYVHGARTPYQKLRGPGEIGKIIEKCTEPLPNNRYKSIKKLRADLFDALESHDASSKTPQETKALEILSQVSWTRDDLDYVFIHFDELSAGNRFNSNLILAIDENILVFMSTEHPEYISALCDHVLDYNIYREGSFDFGFCDVLANKIEQFIKFSDMEGQAKLLLSLLMLGTRHNRWYVERIFVERAGPETDDNLIKRMLTEGVVRELNVRRYLDHLPRSIDISADEVHPLLEIEVE